MKPDDIVDTHMLADALRTVLPKGRKHTPKGWESFNCVMCQANGEPSRDTKRKGNIIFNGPSFTYRCWRCKFKASYRPGMNFTRNLEKLYKELGVDDDDMLELKLNVMTIKQFVTSDEYSGHDAVTEFVARDDFQPMELPKGSFDIGTLEGGDKLYEDEDFVKVLMYAETLGERILNYPLYYTADNSETPSHVMNNRLIVPFFYKDTIVGYTARYFERKNPSSIAKYITHLPDDFLFNNKYLMDWKRKYVVLVEGPMDAIPINGVAYLKDTLTKGQINWINGSGKEVILVPDRGESAGAAVEQAIEQGWMVSMPKDWSKDVKDTHDAYVAYGALYTLEQILENKLSDPTSIRMRWKTWK